ncbi:MAG: murein biosynthesis integral membrane protein MurJ [Chloroflexota bacterium]
MSKIARATFLIAFFFSIDKAFSFVRQALLSRVFTSAELDIFFVSNNIPDLVSALISGGALTVAFIPVLAEYLQHQGRPAAWELFSRVLNLAFLITAAISLVIIALAVPLVKGLIAPGFSPAQQALTASLMRLDFVAILIFSISGLCMAGLQANQHFLLPAMAPTFYNVGQIFGILVLAAGRGVQVQLGPLTLPALGMGMGLYGLVYGVILGAALHLAVQLPGLIRYGFRWKPLTDWRDAGVQKVLALMGPRVLTILCLQFYFVGRDNFASHLPEGSVTVLNYGWFVMQVPETLIGTAIAIAVLPSLAEFVTRGEFAAFTETVNRALRVLLALTLPAAALLAVGIEPLAQAAFGFAAEQTWLLAWTTRVYLLALLGHTWLEVAVRSFYANQNARIPLVGALCQIVLYLTLAVLLSRGMGVVGLALADTLSFTAQALVLLVLLNRRFAGVFAVLGTFWRSLAGAVLGALLSWLLMRFLPLPLLPLTIFALAAGGLLVLPFIWKEVKVLVRL